MGKSLVLFGLMCLGVFSIMGQEKNSDITLDLEGFIKHDVFYDTRQVVSAREGHFLLWPRRQEEDSEGRDINAQSSFNMLSLQSRLSGRVSGPDLLGAQTSGRLEGDFFAQANDNIHLFRLRHAFIRLDWEDTHLTMGQYWNPLFVTSCFPATVSFNTGVPIQPFARNPQIRLRQEIGRFDVILAALSQRDYVSHAQGKASSRFLRQSGLPDMHLQLHYAASQWKAGAGLAYKAIVPRLQTGVGLATDARVSGWSFLAFTSLQLDAFTIKLEAFSGQNVSDVLQISGYAVEQMNPTTDQRSYLPRRNFSLWADIHTNGKPFQAGLFAGYTRNLGTPSPVIDNPQLIYGFGNQIASLYRIAPRILYHANPLRFALEVEYTSAAFGQEFDRHAVPVNLHRTTNMRILFATYYFFNR